MLDWDDSDWNCSLLGMWEDGGAQLAEVMDSWLHMRKWAWVGCSSRDAQQHLSSRDGGGIWWPTRLLCQDLGQLAQTSSPDCPCTHFSQRTSRVITSSDTKPSHLWLSSCFLLSDEEMWLLRALVQCCHLRRILLGTVFTFILIQVLENKTDPRQWRTEDAFACLSSIFPLYVGCQPLPVQLHLLLRPICATLLLFMLLLMHISICIWGFSACDT